MKIYNEKDDFTKSIFTDKRVAIVGPAGYMDNNEFGEYIDSYDVVARFLESLDGLHKVPKQVGKKTNVIVSSLSAINPHIPQINWKDKGKIILCPFFFPGYFEKLDKGIDELKVHSNKNNLEINLCVRNKDSFIEFWKQVQAGPTTGVSAIDYILQFDVKELHITGFTFNHLKSEYMKSYKVKTPPDDGHWHYPLADEVFCNKLIRANKKITVDHHIKNKVLLSDDELNDSIKKLIKNPKGHKYVKGK